MEVTGILTVWTFQFIFPLMEISNFPALGTIGAVKQSDTRRHGCVAEIF